MNPFRHVLRNEAGEGGDPGTGTDPGKKPDDDAAAAGQAGEGASGDDANGANGAADQLPQVTVEQFRKILAGDDDKFLKELERYSDIPGVRKAWQAKNARLSEGFKPEPFPDKGTDEQKAAWREAQGIPKEEGTYLENVGDGIVIGEDDKEIFGSFAKFAHEANMPQSMFDVAAKWYMDFAEERQASVHDQDLKDRTEVDDALTTEYGPAEYRANKSNILNLINTHFPKEAAEAIVNARLPDGKGVFNDVGIIKGFVEIARQLNPMPTLVGQGNDPGKSIDNRLAEIQAMRKKDYDAYMKNEAILKEERELLTAKQRLGSRAA